MASTFDWERAVQQDKNLQRLDTFVQKVIDKLPGESVSVRANAGRGGSKYAAPAVKSEPTTTKNTTMESPSVANGSARDSDAPQFIDFRLYDGGSSSEVDTREVDPMDELSDFEMGLQPSQQSQPKPQQEQQEQESEVMDDGNDVDMVDESAPESAAESAMEEEEDDKVCEVCKVSENEAQTILCDACDAEYHIYCLSPPLSSVPEDSWFCPNCTAKRAEEALKVKEERIRAASGGATGSTTPIANGVAAGSSGSTSNGPVVGNKPDSNDLTAIPIARALEEDPEKTNSLLVHACNCDNVKCTDPEFQVFCPHMKRLLRSVCWASHNAQWRTFGFAMVTAKMFAYHTMHCTLEHCNVPLCEKLRKEEIV